MEAYQLEQSSWTSGFDSGFPVSILYPWQQFELAYRFGSRMRLATNYELKRNNHVKRQSSCSLSECSQQTMVQWLMRVNDYLSFVADLITCCFQNALKQLAEYQDFVVDLMSHWSLQKARASSRLLCRKPLGKKGGASLNLVDPTIGPQQRKTRELI